MRGDEVFVNRSIGNQLLVVSPLFNPLRIEVYSCAYRVPALRQELAMGSLEVPAVSVSSIYGERGGRLPALCLSTPLAGSLLLHGSRQRITIEAPTFPTFMTGWS